MTVKRNSFRLHQLFNHTFCIDEHVDNDTEEVADQDNEENEGTEGLSAEDILTQSMEAMNAINSFSSEMKVDQVIDFGEVDPELGSSSMTTATCRSNKALIPLTPIPF